MDGILAIDAHAHPYNINSIHYFLYGRLMPPRTISTVEKMKEAGLDASVFAAVGDRWKADDPSKSSFEDTIIQLKRIKNLEERDKIRILKTKSDFSFNKVKDAKFGAIMAIEGGDALEGEILNLDRFYDYGVRLITVLHKNNNEIGFNQESQTDGPLTAFGIKVVEKMNQMGFILDVAHSKTKTLKSISKVSQQPLLDSHTDLFPEGEENSFSNRARTWEEMELIAKSGGVICTMPVGYTLGNYSRTTLKSWVDVIFLMKKRLGIDHIGLGTDSSGLPQLVDGWDSISSLPYLLIELKNAGFSIAEINAFVGGNFLRLARLSIH